MTVPPRRSRCWWFDPPANGAVVWAGRGRWLASGTGSRPTGRASSTTGDRRPDGRATAGEKGAHTPEVHEGGQVPDAGVGNASAPNKASNAATDPAILRPRRAKIWVDREVPHAIPTKAKRLQEDLCLQGRGSRWLQAVRGRSGRRVDEGVQDPQRSIPPATVAGAESASGRLGADLVHPADDSLLGAGLRRRQRRQVENCLSG
jgi:hypothetical protein